MKYSLLSACLLASLGTSCGSSGSGDKNKTGGGQTGPTNLTAPTDNECAAENWTLSLTGLVVTERDELGQDGSGLPPTEQTDSMLASSEDYLVFRASEGAQTKLQTLTQFSLGDMRYSTTIDVKGNKPQTIAGCKSLADLLKGKSLLSDKGEPAIYRNFAFKHDATETATALFGEVEKLRQKDGWDTTAALFKDGVEAKVKTFMMDVTYERAEQVANPPKVLAIHQSEVAMDCKTPFRVKAIVRGFDDSEVQAMKVDPKQCIIKSVNGQQVHQCVLLKIEHTADQCQFTVLDAPIAGTNDATHGVSLSGKLESNPKTSAKNNAPVYSLTVDKIRIDK